MIISRLLRISFNTLLNSLLPVLMWILLGEIVNKDIANIFTITYSFQFIITLLVSIFGTGPNITSKKENKNNIIDSNILLGTFVTFIVVLLFSLKVDSYIRYMNLEPSIYSKYCVYSFCVMLFQAVIRMICEKLYFKEEHKKANRITTIFNITNIVLIVMTSLLIKDNMIAIATTLAVDLILVTYILVSNINKLSFHFAIKDNIKYVSNDIFDSLGMFIVFFIGQKTTFAFGTMYLVAMNFESLITDAQWDMSYSIITAATIDASKNELHYKESLNNGRKLVGLLIFSSVFMGVFLYPFYKPSLWILAIYVGVQVINLIVSPKIWLRQQYIQINYSAKKNTFHKNVFEIIRIIFSFVPTPFCTYISQFIAMLYEVIVYDIYYKNKFYVDEKGYLKMKIDSRTDGKYLKERLESISFKGDENENWY